MINRLETVRDGFDFFINHYGDEFLVLKSSNLNNQIEYYEENQLENILISWYNGFDKDSISFIRELKVKKLMLCTFNIRNFSVINEKKELEFLRIYSDPIPDEIDFSGLPNLEVFEGWWTKKLKNLFSNKRLMVLCLWQYKSASKELGEFEGLENLESLNLIQSNVRSLRGLEKLERLKNLGLAYNKNLEAFTDSTVNFQLQELEIEVCKKLDLSSLRGVKSLKTLKIINNGKIKTLEPILKNLPALEHLQFTESELTDGNNLYLLRQPALKKVVLKDKKHYLLKAKDINEALADAEKKANLLSKN